MLATVLLAVMTSAAQIAGCSPAMASAAEDQSGSIRSSEALYLAFQRYAVCDDGAIAEGFSDSVTIILSDKWKSIDQMNRLVATNARFRSFVLKHVNSTADPKRLKKIKQLATTQCPSAAKSLCTDLVQKTDRAILEQLR